MTAVQLFESLRPQSQYFDKHLGIDQNEYQERLKVSTTVYLGNLSIYTKEESIYELFSMCGNIKEIIMGRHKETGQPLGFGFVEFFNHDDAAAAIDNLSFSKLDNRIIRVDWDSGFIEGRQYGRGYGGLQVRDSIRKEQDPQRPKSTYYEDMERKAFLFIHYYDFLQKIQQGRKPKEKKVSFLSIFYWFSSFSQEDPSKKINK